MGGGGTTTTGEPHIYDLRERKGPHIPSSGVATAPQGRHPWTPEETKEMTRVAMEHVTDARGHVHIDWDAVARDLHAKGYERSASALAAHWKQCPHPSHFSTKGRPIEGVRAYSPPPPGAAGAGGGPHKWSVEEECLMMALAEKFIVRGGSGRGGGKKHHVDWEAVARELRDAGFERSGNAVAAHYHKATE